MLLHFVECIDSFACIEAKSVLDMLYLMELFLCCLHPPIINYKNVQAILNPREATRVFQVVLYGFERICHFLIIKSNSLFSICTCQNYFFHFAEKIINNQRIFHFINFSTQYFEAFIQDFILISSID